VKYNKNKNIQITFTIRENLYFRFKTLCKAEKKMPATVLKEFIKSYVDEKEINNRNDDYSSY
jgi:predicted DNA-binding protein